MKKIMKSGGLLLTIIFVLTLFAGCAQENNGDSAVQDSGSGGQTADTEVQNEEIKIGISMRETKNPFYKVMSDTIVAECDENGIEVVALDAANSMDQQTADLENLMAQECTVIICDLLDPNAFATTIQQAVDMGIYVIAVDNSVSSDTPVTCSVLTDNFGNGEMVGTWAAEQMGNEPIRALVISGEIGNEVGADRRDGIIQGILEYQLAQNGKTDFEVVYQFYCDGWNVEVVNEKFEDVAPTLDFNMIISESDVLTQYCYDSLVSLGLEDKVFTAAAADGEKSCLEMIKDGKFDVTAMNSPTALAQTAFETAVQLMNGETVAAEVYTEATCVTQDNVDQYYDPDSPF